MLAPSIDNERELVLLVAAGDEKAFRRLFDFYWRRIYSVAFVLTKSSVLSEEIVQDVFLKIWLNKDKLSSVLKFEGYLFVVARNHIYNVLRQKTVEQPFIEHLEQHFFETTALPEQEMLLKETKQLVDSAVKLLPGQQRAVYELSRIDGLDHSRIAEELNISKLTVKSHMTKALQSIRHYLQLHSYELFLGSCIVSLLLL